ncbi:uncharacterized protein [Apostichopus japonicus]|uniref:uncharacterized protein isoform X2 n=1 Tax=Stichopus japonicus TaxID=307972 RepID=UPI003AB5DE13
MRLVSDRELDFEKDSSKVWRSLSIPLVMATTPDIVVGAQTPIRTPPTATMESITGLDDSIEFMDAGDITPPITTEVDCAIASPADSPLSSNSGTLKARKYKPKDNSPKAEKTCPSSPKVPHSMRKESSLPQVRADTVKVMEMFLKRRSKSLNDAVLTKEYFEREKRRKKSRPTRNTVTVVQRQEIREETSETNDKTEVKLRDRSERTVLPRGHESYVWAMENTLEVELSGADNIADDELSSPEVGKSRSAPSTLRLHVQRVSEAEIETLENGSLTLTRDHQRKERKDVKRKKSILEKAKRIMRSPSTQRKTIVVADEDSYSPSCAKEEVHSEMKKTGFTSRLKRTFSRKDNKKSRDEPSPRGSPSTTAERNKSLERNKSSEKRSSLDRKKTSDESKSSEKNKSLNRSESKDKHSRRWPFKRRSKKNVPTPTDESAAGASDSASMRDWASSSDISSNYTLSLNETERRKMVIDIRRGIHLRSSGNFSDSQILYGPIPRSERPRSVPHGLRESNGSLASSEGSDRRTSRPTSLIFRERRAERSRRGLNDVMNLDSTTPGHIRRNVHTRELEYSMSLSMASDLEAQGLEEGSRVQGEENTGDEDPSRRVSRTSLGSSWTSSTWEESGASGSDVPFEQRSVDEQEEFFKRIADRLAQIGDQVVQEYHFESDTGGRGEEAGPSQAKASLLAEESRSLRGNGASSGGASGSTSDLNDAIGSRIRRTVDGVSRGRNQPIPTDMIRRVIYDSAYVTFQEAVQSLINRNPGMEEISQLALVFHFTKQACKLAQAFGRKANSIKENSINYIGHKFAAWIDSQGGWGVVVESDSEDSVQESEID